ncbi:hypothetical protein EGW08_008638, partial [Elysia chlorotica]
GKIPFNGTVNGRSCQGTVSDWDEKRCTTRGVFELASDTCKELILPSEFQCLSFIEDKKVNLQQLVITRSMDGTNSYNCWILTSYLSVDRSPLRILYRMPTAQCSLVTEIDLTNSNSNAVLYLDDKKKTKDCFPKEVRFPVVQTLGNKASVNPGYNVVGSNKTGLAQNTAVQVDSDQSKDSSGQSSPITDAHHTDPHIRAITRTA